MRNGLKSWHELILSENFDNESNGDWGQFGFLFFSLKWRSYGTRLTNLTWPTRFYEDGLLLDNVLKYVTYVLIITLLQMWSKIFFLACLVYRSLNVMNGL